MTAAITAADLLTQLVEDNSYGEVLHDFAKPSATTSITLATEENVGPTTGASKPINSPLFLMQPGDHGTVTSGSTTVLTDSAKAWTVDEWINLYLTIYPQAGGRRRVKITDSDATTLTYAAIDTAPAAGDKYAIDGGKTRLSNYVSSTGVISVNPLIGGAWDAAQDRVRTAILLDPRFDRVDRLMEAINRALSERVFRWVPRPLTMVPDGDLQGAKVTDYWTAAANGTAAYASSQIFPAGSAADTYGQTNVDRLLQLTTSGGASTLTGNGIRVPVSTHQAVWYFLTAIRLVSGTGTAEFKIRDNTNSADITLQVTRGNDSNTLTTTTLGDFMVCEGTLQLPATCAELAPQLTLDATGLVAQMGPVIMFPLDAYSFPLPNRIRTEDDIGNFMYATGGMSPANLGAMSWSTPITTQGRQHWFAHGGDHPTVVFNFKPGRAVWYEEAVHYPELIGPSDSTFAPKDWVLREAEAEIAEWLYKREEMKPIRTGDGVKVPPAFLRRAREARRAADESPQRPQVKTVVGRRR